jgi:capsular polysaccharide transport system permease protein
MPDTSQLATYARLLQLTPVTDYASAPIGTAPAQVDCPAQAARRPRYLASLRIEGLVSLLLLVVLPTALAACYFWVLAADRYQSEAHFVLRVPGRAMVGAPTFANLVQATGITRSTDDGYVVQEFLESRDALGWLQAHASIETAYAGAGRDFVWRFPGPLWSNTQEGLYRLFRRMTSTDFDSASGVTTLKVEAFAPADAQRLAASLLDAAEDLVNRLNERSRKDAVRLAEGEEARMRERALAAQAALTEFRERERLVDPNQSTLAVLETIATLAADAANVSVQIGELARASPSAPQIAGLRTRRAAIETQIGLERQRLAGDAKSIAPRIAEYERLMLEREFAEKALMSAMTTVASARLETLRQQIYLERVATPGRPDYPAYPKRVLWCLGIAAAGFMAWRIWRVIAADAQRHIER